MAPNNEDGGRLYAGVQAAMHYCIFRMHFPPVVKSRIWYAWLWPVRTLPPHCVYSLEG